MSDEVDRPVEVEFEGPEAPLLDDAQPPLLFEPPVDWWELAPNERVVQLARLREFVDELVTRYCLPESVIPPCWFEHEAMVQELLALKQFREVKFSSKSPATDPLDWHYQLSGQVMLRLRAWVSITQCGTKHEPSRLQRFLMSGTPAADSYGSALDAFVPRLARGDAYTEQQGKD